MSNWDFHGTLHVGQQWYCTEIIAMHPMKKQLSIFGGPNVPGISFADAQNYCNENLGFCRVIGIMVAEIPTKADDITPDFDKQINYDNSQN